MHPLVVKGGSSLTFACYSPPGKVESSISSKIDSNVKASGKICTHFGKWNYMVIGDTGVSSRATMVAIYLLGGFSISVSLAKLVFPPFRGKGQHQA